MTRRCLVLAPFPMVLPRHGGQVRAASILHALAAADWEVETAGLYLAAAFPKDEWGPLDIVIDDPAVTRRALGDMLFADLHVARAAAADAGVVAELRALLLRLRPDVVHVEHPWSWLVLERALPPGERPLIVYSSQNVEWRTRPPMFKLGLERPGAARLVEATRLLEEEFARAADLVLAISDLEAAEIEAETGRSVTYVPPVSDLAEGSPATHATFTREARASQCRYAALMGSAYWPNVEGFFAMAPDGLGFLSPDQRIWVAGGLGPALRADPRFLDFQAINDARMRAWGYVADSNKASFFASATCVVVPVGIGGGAKLKSADALASGRPVIITPHALEGYGPLVQDALGQGVYVAETAREFRGLLRAGLRQELVGCTPEVRARLSPARLAATLDALYGGALASAPG